jgi:hypothetical protein
MFTSEYFIMLKKNGNLDTWDLQDYQDRLYECIDGHGMLNRAPDDPDQEGPDDYYGVTNGCMEMGIVSAPRKFLWALIRYLGCLNNNAPGIWTLDSFLARQPQLVCSILSAAFPSIVNPLHWAIRILASPLYLISALVLAFSCIGAKPGDCDAWRLTWHLGNCVSKVSLMNWLAYKLWLWRLHKVCPNGMKDVAAGYYQPYGNSPYSKWWVD